MKYLLSLAFLLLLTSSMSAQKNVNWMSWEDAMTAAETNPKKIYIDIYTDWCGYCKKMDKTTFKDPGVVKYLNDHFYAVKFNAEQKESITFNEKEFNYIATGGRGVHELAYAMLNGQLGYPAFVVLDEEFARILISPGYKGPDAVMMEMKFAKDEKYKTMAWANYQAEYQAANKPAAPNAAPNAAPKAPIRPAANTKPQTPNKPSTAASPNSASRSTEATKPNSPQAATKPTKKTASTKATKPAPKSAMNEEGVFVTTEVYPRFPGCEDNGLNESDTQKCAEEKMLTFIYKNIVYPKIARENGVEGMIVLQFVVGKDGVIRDPKIVRDIGANCGEAGLDMVAKMPKWIPGKQRGEAVDVMYTLPVRFKLQKEATNKGTAREDLIPPPPPPVREQEEEVFKVVEKMPRFNACEDLGMNEKETTDCAQDKMLQYIYGNLVYPKQAKKNATQGTVIVNFTIGTDGSIIEPKVLRGLGDGCDEAALDVINSMPKWIPGMQRGKPVNVLYTIPIKFKLDL